MLDNSLYNSKWLVGHYHPQIVAYYFREWNGYDMRMHIHNQVEIMYVIKGCCTIETEKESFNIQKGDFILLDSNIPHRLLVAKDQPCRMLNVEFAFKEKDTSFSSLKELISDNPSVAFLLQSKKPYWLLKDPDEIYSAFKSLIMELDSAGTGGFMIQLLLAQILIKIARLAEEAAGQETISGSIYIKKALQYIHQHYDRDLHIEDIALVVNLNEGYFHRIFKSYTGFTPLEYLTRLRLDKAKMLLTYTDIPIIDICNYIGINSRQYFTCLFKKHTEITPAGFRKSVDRFEQLK